jgi:predicted nucleotidyltransferase component of viral defense system
MNNSLCLNILPNYQLSLFNIIAEDAYFTNFYLAGGTGLALQYSHRQSIDFDFFTPNDLNTTKIIQKIRTFGKFELQHQEKNTLIGILNDVRISFITYQYKIINKFKRYKNINIADEFDIAAMKLEAISGRGSKKDFVDFYFILKNISLQDIFKLYEKKYGKAISNNYHLLKSLVYFEDAEVQAMPKMIKQADWETIKKVIINEVKKITRF